MKQVKIEGNNLIPGRLRITEPTIISIWGHEFTREEFDRMVEQHKPPTWEDLLNGWKETINDTLIKYDVYLKETPTELWVQYCEPNSKVLNQAYTFNKEDYSCKNFYDPHCYIPNNRNIIINLTIRYLESQKEKENE